MQPLVLSGLSILILEDEPMLRKQLAAHLEHLGADVTQATTLESATRLLDGMDYDYALLDVNLPDGLGTDLLKSGKISENTGIIVMTAQGAISGAIDAIRLGALDYLVKPFDPALLGLVISRARQSQQIARVEKHKQTPGESLPFYFGSAMAGLEHQAAKILQADKRLEHKLPPILILGETGTGKTSLARWIHNRGPRNKFPLVEINCSALPETLAEAELFGHERGAFTDAKTLRMGLFEAAHGGTLFLDEVPSLSHSAQAKVLKAVEDGRIRRLGGSKEIEINVRVIAASNRNLQELVKQGQFREDLYHRLNLLTLQIPPLRERTQDIVELATLLLKSLQRKHRLKETPISPAGAQKLRNYSWPGNVRELGHELERAIIFEEGDEFHFNNLNRASAESDQRPNFEAHEWFNENFRFPESGFDLEQGILRIINHALKQSGNNVSAAARLLGVPRDYIRYRLGQKSGSPAPP